MNKGDWPTSSRALSHDRVSANASDHVRSSPLKRSKPDTHNSSQEKSFDCESEKKPKRKKTAAKRVKLQNKTTVSILRHFRKAAPTMSQQPNEKSGEGDMEDEWADVDSDEPSNKDILKCLKTMHDDLNRRLDTQSEAMERIKVEFSDKLKEQEQKVEVLNGEVFDLKSQNDSLRKELEEAKRKQKEVDEQMKEVRFSAKLAVDRSNRNEQYSRRNNVKLLYVEEGDGETAAECEKKVLEVFNDKLGLGLTADHIEAAHRIGKSHGPDVHHS